MIHSFWVPNLHGKKDMIPGRNRDHRVPRRRPGVYRGQCAEFCGYEHALMAFLVVADPPARIRGVGGTAARAGARAPSSDLEARGQQLFMMGTTARSATRSRHVGERTGRAGPHAPREPPDLAAGTLANDRESLAHWITDPRALKPGTRTCRRPPRRPPICRRWSPTSGRCNDRPRRTPAP